jgi:hypothetical protein
MRTDDLIRILTEDHAARPRPAPLERGFVIALAGGAVVAAGLFAAALGPRPDFLAALTSSWRFVFKFVVTLALAAAAAPLVLRASRPTGGAGRGAMGLAAAPILLAAAVAVELYTIPQSDWPARAIGSNALACVISVTALSMAPLAATLYALRRGAPCSPGFSGALAGLLSGALAAALYGAHCTDDSPLFVAIWYSLGISIVTLLGALIGARALRW